jgi:Flp pilus assembly protein TadG
VIRRFARNLASNSSGATIVEFALIFPALGVLLFGLFDLSYNMYTAQMLQGAIQDAARDSSIEGAADKTEALDSIVTRAVQAIAPNSTLAFSRKSYSNFSDAAKPEDFTDLDGNGECSGGEPFEDANGNGAWDADRGSTGFGGARDAVLYSVTVTYKRPFPIATFIPGQTENFVLTARTILRNQPYGAQNQEAPTVGNCA